MTALHADVLVRLVVLALASYALVGQVGKPGLRLLVRWRRRRAGALSRLTEEAIRWATRVGALVIGGGLGALPVWPAGVSATWGVLLGVVAGSLAPGLHHATERALASRIAALALPARAAAFLGGGSVVHEEER